MPYSFFVSVFLTNDKIRRSIKRVCIASSTGNGTYNVTNIPNYQDLTADNFAFVATYADGSGGFCGSGSNGQYFNLGGSCGIGPALSYNASIGKITLSGCSDSAQSDYHSTYEIGYRYGAVSISGNLYCYYCE